MGTTVGTVFVVLTGAASSASTDCPVGGCLTFVPRAWQFKEETMKHFLSKLIVAGFALSAIGTASAADQKARPINADQAKKIIEAAGYTNVRNVHQEKD